LSKLIYDEIHKNFSIESNINLNKEEDEDPEEKPAETVETLNREIENAKNVEKKTIYGNNALKENELKVDNEANHNSQSNSLSEDFENFILAMAMDPYDLLVI